MATNFSARLTAPSQDNKWYISSTKGGYNRCIVINGQTGSVLPNCCGYAYGRFMEETGAIKCYLSRGNAENWYGYNDGYPRGQEPKLGAVMCWRKGQTGNESDGAGHVGIVEVIDGDKITVSMSAYGGSRWYTRKFTKGSYSYNGLTFQGFIYNPDVTLVLKPIDEVAKEVINGAWGNGETRRKRLTEAGYNYDEVQNRVNEILHSENNNKLKVGDSVKIVNYGNAMANGNGRKAYGYGWTRRILKIYDGYAYPYQVGNNSGTTGFYKADALKKL